MTSQIAAVKTVFMVFGSALCTTLNWNVIANFLIPSFFPPVWKKFLFAPVLKIIWIFRTFSKRMFLALTAKILFGTKLIKIFPDVFTFIFNVSSSILPTKKFYRFRNVTALNLYKNFLLFRLPPTLMIFKEFLDRNFYNFKSSDGVREKSVKLGLAWKKVKGNIARKFR